MDATTMSDAAVLTDSGPADMDASSACPGRIACCSGDVEETPACSSGVWSCPTGFEERPLGGCSGDGG